MAVVIHTTDRMSDLDRSSLADGVNHGHCGTALQIFVLISDGIVDHASEIHGGSLAVRPPGSSRQGSDRWPVSLSALTGNPKPNV
jgi:hypothetical protein